LETDKKLTNGLGLQEDLEEGEMCTKLMEVQKQMMRLTTLVQDDLPLYETAENRHETWIEKATRRLSPSKTESSPKSNEAKDDETGASSASSCIRQHASAYARTKRLRTTKQVRHLHRRNRCVIKRLRTTKQVRHLRPRVTSSVTIPVTRVFVVFLFFKARVFVVFLFFKGGFAAAAFCYVVVFLSHVFFGGDFA